MELAPVVIERLVETARRAQAMAYAPYSNFPVGAAVLADDGRIFPGCNVENSSFGLTVCAERNAVAAAVVAGARPTAVAVVANGNGVAPCGACRQVLAEFAAGMPVILAQPTGEVGQVVALDALLPGAFVFGKP
ncbi:MAG: cytidine deaminase [Thermoanaerobaculaceae bacterium]|nr:cytidine deaminase [Thermoanaerobaculaceae bacterium]TAM44615.1 MAG: cytidine deaminase [Acidobacteriota bacterium]